MDTNKIQQAYADKRAAEEQSKQSVKDTEKYKKKLIGSDRIQKAIIESTRLSIEHRDGLEPKVEVKNFPKPITKISTPDVSKVVKQLKILEKSLSPQNIDFKPVQSALVNLGKKLDIIIKTPEKEDVLVSNLGSLKPYFDNITKSIKSIDVAPVVNVKPADVKIKDTPIDLQPVIDSVKELGKHFTSMKMPDNTKQFNALIAAQASLENTISNLKFPVANYVLPFKDINGNATQVQLDANGKVPTSGGGSSSTSNYAVAVDDYTTANVIYVGKAAIGSVSTDATWQIKKVDANTGAIINWADGNDNFDNVWGTTFTSGDVASLTYS